MIRSLVTGTDRTFLIDEHDKVVKELTEVSFGEMTVSGFSECVLTVNIYSISDNALAEVAWLRDNVPAIIQLQHNV